MIVIVRILAQSLVCCLQWQQAAREPCVVTRIPVSADNLMSYCCERLANYKTPNQIRFVHTLPCNAVGKIDKKELRKHYVN